MNHFTNAFVRQLGRESAHSFYKDVTSYTTETSIKSDSELKPFCSHNVVNWIVWIFFAFIIPYIMIIPFIDGVKRLFNVYCFVKVTEHTYKYDRRCRGGQKYCGSVDTWDEVKKPKEDCSDEDIRTSRIVGLVQIVISVVMFFVSHSLWMSFM